jgi:hypothetical protein
VTLRWRLGTAPDAPVAVLGETRMELWPASAGPPDDPAITVAGELLDGGQEVRLVRTALQTTAVAAEGILRYRHRVIVHDPDIDDDLVLLRGFVSVAPPEASP